MREIDKSTRVFFILIIYMLLAMLGLFFFKSLSFSMKILMFSVCNFFIFCLALIFRKNKNFNKQYIVLVFIILLGVYFFTLLNYSDRNSSVLLNFKKDLPVFESKNERNNSTFKAYVSAVNNKNYSFFDISYFPYNVNFYLYKDGKCLSKFSSRKESLDEFVDSLEKGKFSMDIKNSDDFVKLKFYKGIETDKSYVNDYSFLVIPLIVESLPEQNSKINKSE